MFLSFDALKKLSTLTGLIDGVGGTITIKSNSDSVVFFVIKTDKIDQSYFCQKNPLDAISGAIDDVKSRKINKRYIPKNLI